MEIQSYKLLSLYLFEWSDQMLVPVLISHFRQPSDYIERLGHYFMCQIYIWTL